MVLIRSVPGIGLVTGMLFLSEIETIARFENNDKFAGMIGIVPDCHSSEDKEILEKSLLEGTFICVVG